MSEDPEERRVAELLDRSPAASLARRNAGGTRLYAAEDPDLRAQIEARRQQARLGGGWLARVEAEHRIAQAERSAGVVLERGIAAGIMALGAVAWFFIPALGAAGVALGAALLVFSWNRVNHRGDPYRDIQR